MKPRNIGLSLLLLVVTGCGGSGSSSNHDEQKAAYFKAIAEANAAKAIAEAAKVEVGDP